jgi:lipoprotein-anchoring transpeptidase ErfK/SrfK
MKSKTCKNQVFKWGQAAAPPRELVPYGGRYAPGTIVISTEERRLYYFLPGAKALRYGVGGPGFTWTKASR